MTDQRAADRLAGAHPADHRAHVVAWIAHRDGLDLGAVLAIEELRAEPPADGPLKANLARSRLDDIVQSLESGRPHFPPQFGHAPTTPRGAGRPRKDEGPAPGMTALVVRGVRRLWWLVVALPAARSRAAVARRQQGDPTRLRIEAILRDLGEGATPAQVLDRWADAPPDGADIPDESTVRRYMAARRVSRG